MFQRFPWDPRPARRIKKRRRATTNKGWTNTQKQMIKDFGVSGLLVTKLWVRHHGDELKIEAALRRHCQHRREMKEANKEVRFVTSHQFQAVFGKAEGKASELQACVFNLLDSLELPALPGFVVPNNKLAVITGFEGTPLTQAKVLEMVESHVQQI
jgi:hypothetical protein